MCKCSSTIILTQLIILSTKLGRIHTGTSLCIKELPPFEQFEPPICTTPNQTYKTFVEESGIFIDKTLLIEEILTNSRLRNRISFIHYPPGTGKTTNLKMFWTFFQPDLTTRGVVKTYTNTWSYQFFTTGVINETHKLQKAPKISNYEYFIDKFLAQYPVVYIDFSIPLPNNLTYENFREWFFTKVVDDTYRPHKYLIRHLTATISNESILYSKRVEARDILQQFESILEPDKRKGMVALLCEVLFKFFNHMVFVLINDYDRALTWARDNALSDHDLESIEAFLVEFMRITLNKNRNVCQAIIIGTDRSIGRRMRAAVEEFQEFHFRSQKDAVLSNFFGFNFIELDELFIETKIPKDLQQIAYSSCFSYQNYRNKSFYDVPCIVKLINTREIEQKITASFDYDEFLKYHPTAA